MFEVNFMSFLFCYLAILNFFDAAVTWFGLRHAFIAEVNPVMDAVYGANPFLFLAIKLILSFFLLFFMIRGIVPQSSFVKGITFFAAFLYTAVVSMHGFWLAKVF
ncbi:DUF5658 family protein [Bacillus sp. REN3]|uniref:DUF5658 family protein n=1 Tax=Bacillus sp. REN3 TaxID=2802440 RepID=UPI001AED7D4F|nr:DUF5658 family protein [Bacillus sp. REN3]